MGIYDHIEKSFWDVPLAEVDREPLEDYYRWAMKRLVESKGKGKAERKKWAIYSYVLQVMWANTQYEQMGG